MIYVITKDNGYGDHLVCAATTDRSRADIICKLYSDIKGEAKIGEFEDGAIDIDVTKVVNAWHVTIIQYAGEEPMVKAREFTSYGMFGPHEHFNATPSRVELHVYVVAETEEEAMAIARSAWAAHKGSNFGIT